MYISRVFKEECDAAGPQKRGSSYKVQNFKGLRKMSTVEKADFLHRRYLCTVSFLHIDQGAQLAQHEFWITVSYARGL